MSSSRDNGLNGKIISLNHYSWDEVIAAFESELYKQSKSEITIERYAACINIFSNFYRESLKKPGPYVEKLEKSDFRAFINYLRHDRQLSTPSVNRNVVALRAFSRFIFAKGLHRKFLAKDLKTYRVQTTKTIPHLSKREVRRIVTAVDLNSRNGYRNLAILQLFLQCGLSVGEVVRLSRNDITLHKTKGTIRVRDDKKGSQREIPLNKTVRKALNNYLEIRGPIAGHEPVFVSERQHRIGVATIQHMIKRILCIAGHEDLTTQDLRHHFAMEFYMRSDGDLVATQKVLGHSNIITTARYAKAFTHKIQEAIDGMDS
ncbi:MAG: tyrosine-type recombinase/integrase [Thermotogota bacterium]|nr:tyrosine-type recombinase/integrase [Thermotogota bacterium]